MQAHVGNKVKQVAFAQRMSAKSIARVIGMSPQGVRKLMRREIVHPKWIPALNKALDHDFWQYYGKTTPPADPAPQTDPAELEALKKEKAGLKKELEYLKEIIELLRKSQD